MRRIARTTRLGIEKAWPFSRSPMGTISPFQKPVIIALIFMMFGVICDRTLAQTSVQPFPQQPTFDPRLSRELQSVHSIILTGDYEAAQKMIATLRKNFGPHPQIDAELKFLYRQKKDYFALREIIEHELETSADDFDPLCQLGEVYFLSDSLDKARHSWERAFDLIKTEEHRFQILAGYYLTYGFYAEAIDVYRRARTVLKDQTKFSNELIDIYVAQRNFPEALGEYLAQLDRNPEAGNEISLQISMLAGLIEDQSLIRRELTTALRRSPKNPELHRLLGDLESHAGNYESALGYFQTADNLAGGKGEYLLAYAGNCFNNGRYSIAVRAVDLSLTGESGKRKAGPAMILKARSLHKLNQPQAALEILRQLSEDPDPGIKAEAAYAAGEIYAESPDDRADAVALFQRSASTKPKTRFSWLSSLRLAETYAIAGDFLKADAELKRLRSDPAAPEDIIEKAIYLSAEFAFFELDLDSAVAGYEALINRFPSGRYVNDCLERLNILESGEDLSVKNLAQALRLGFGGQKDSSIIILKSIAGSGGAAQEYASISLAEIYANQSSWRSAIDTYEDYINRFPKGIYVDRALLGLALIYSDHLSMPEKAASLANRILAEFPHSPLLEKARAVLAKNQLSPVP